MHERIKSSGSHTQFGKCNCKLYLPHGLYINVYENDYLFSMNWIVRSRLDVMRFCEKKILCIWFMRGSNIFSMNMRS